MNTNWVINRHRVVDCWLRGLNSLHYFCMLHQESVYRAAGQWGSRVVVNFISEKTMKQCPPVWQLSALGLFLTTMGAAIGFLHSPICTLLGMYSAYSLYDLCSSLLPTYLTLNDYLLNKDELKMHQAVVPEDESSQLKYSTTVFFCVISSGVTF